MADFNQILTPGDVENGIVNVVIEIPQGSNHKIEWNRQLAVMQLDRVADNRYFHGGKGHWRAGIC